MSKIRHILLIVALFSVLALSGCINNKASNTTEGTKTITLILDKGGVNDGSFNESAWNGAKQANEELGVEVKYLESNTDADYASNIETAIDLKSDLIIGVGFNLSEAIEKAAINYPEQQFAIVDGSFDTIPSNVTPITFNESEAGYLAGIATAMTLDSDKYGFVGGFEIPAVVNYKNGFEQGLKQVNPNATLSVQYANSFTDAAKGRAIAEQMYGDGVECIMTAAGGVNNGVYEVGSEKNKYAVAVDLAQSNVAPETIITSALKNVDVGVSTAIKRFVEGNLEGGKSIVYNIANDGVGYEQTQFITKETVEYIESIKNK